MTTEHNADPEALILTGDRLVVRSVRSDDRSALAEILGCPGVERWWGSQDADDIDDYVTGADPEVTILMIEHPDQSAHEDQPDNRDRSAPIGMIQFHEEPDPMYRHAGIDIALHDDHQGKGLAGEAIELVVEHLASIGHHRIVIDPNAENHNAIKAYQRVGFEPVGTMRRYEWSEARQTWTDGLLMELLIE
jgi:aminoglycoside 6'-N-acetyltransferase